VEGIWGRGQETPLPAPKNWEMLVFLTILVLLDAVVRSRRVLLAMGWGHEFETNCLFASSPKKRKELPLCCIMGGSVVRFFGLTIAHPASFLLERRFCSVILWSHRTAFSIYSLDCSHKHSRTPRFSFPLRSSLHHYWARLLGNHHANAGARCCYVPSKICILISN
jgi:hypothetical protein